jgi:patatin-like phospholipase/acyl hydrolase
MSPYPGEDGGGVRGLSSLILIKETMKRLGALEGLDELPSPADYFDVIAGTGTGG